MANVTPGNTKRYIDQLIENDHVPKADKLILGFLTAGYQFRGKSEDFDLMAAVSLRYLKARYPQIAAIAEAESGKPSANDADVNKAH